MKGLVDALKKIAAAEVYVGVTEAETSRPGEKITNAGLVMIHTHGARKSEMKAEMDDYMDTTGKPYSAAHSMYIRTHGSPLLRIPARPIIEPAIEANDNRKVIAEELADAARALMDGKPNEAKMHLEAAGQEGENAAKGWFDDPRNAWPPDAPSTITAKGSDQPLVDTGALRQSITHMVKE
jgi:hypothetical protein